MDVIMVQVGPAWVRLDFIEAVDIEESYVGQFRATVRTRDGHLYPLDHCFGAHDYAVSRQAEFVAEIAGVLTPQ